MLQEEDRIRELNFWRNRLRTYSLPIWIGLCFIPLGIVSCVFTGISRIWILLLGGLIIYVFLPIRRDILKKIRELEE